MSLHGSKHPDLQTYSCHSVYGPLYEAWNGPSWQPSGISRLGHWLEESDCLHHLCKTCKQALVYHLDSCLLRIAFTESDNSCNCGISRVPSNDCLGLPTTKLVSSLSIPTFGGLVKTYTFLSLPLVIYFALPLATEIIILMIGLHSLSISSMRILRA